MIYFKCFIFFYTVHVFLLFFFFFQAEDGIRDGTVTGVQTCALPIWLDVSMLEALVAAEDISYGGVLNGGAEYPGPRPGMIVHPIADRYVAVQTVGAPQLW